MNGTVTATYDSWPNESDWFIGVVMNDADGVETMYYACYATDDTGACVGSGWTAGTAYSDGMTMVFDSDYQYVVATYD